MFLSLTHQELLIISTLLLLSHAAMSNFRMECFKVFLEATLEKDFKLSQKYKIVKAAYLCLALSVQYKKEAIAKKLEAVK